MYTLTQKPLTNIAPENALEEFYYPIRINKHLDYSEGYRLVRHVTSIQSLLVDNVTLKITEDTSAFAIPNDRFISIGFNTIKGSVLEKISYCVGLAIHECNHIIHTICDTTKYLKGDNFKFRAQMFNLLEDIYIDNLAIKEGSNLSIFLKCCLQKSFSGYDNKTFDYETMSLSEKVNNLCLPFKQQSTTICTDNGTVKEIWQILEDVRFTDNVINRVLIANELSDLLLSTTESSVVEEENDNNTKSDDSSSSESNSESEIEIDISFDNDLGCEVLEDAYAQDFNLFEDRDLEGSKIVKDIPCNDDPSYVYRIIALSKKTVYEISKTDFFNKAANADYSQFKKISKVKGNVRKPNQRFDSGSKLGSNLHRVSIDGKVFKRSVHKERLVKPNIAIVIDLSYSMVASDLLDKTLATVYRVNEVLKHSCNLKIIGHTSFLSESEDLHTHGVATCIVDFTNFSLEDFAVFSKYFKDSNGNNDRSALEFVIQQYPDVNNIWMFSDGTPSVTKELQCNAETALKGFLANLNERKVSNLHKKIKVKSVSVCSSVLPKNDCIYGKGNSFFIDNSESINRLISTVI